MGGVLSRPEAPEVVELGQDLVLPERLPLFPLPNLVAFPGLVVPLHVFEPRYTSLVDDLEEANPFMGLAVLQPGYEQDYHREPPIHPVVAGGMVRNVERLEDGRFHLLFLSLGRVRVQTEELTASQYRMGTVTWMGFEEESSPQDLSLRLELFEMLALLGESSPVLGERLEKLRGQDLTLGRLVDTVAALLPLQVEVQARLLTELDIAKRAGILLALLRAITGSMPEGIGLN